MRKLVIARPAAALMAWLLTLLEASAVTMATEPCPCSSNFLKASIPKIVQTWG